MAGRDFIEPSKPFCTSQVGVPVRFGVVVLEAVDVRGELALLDAAGAVFTLGEHDGDMLLHRVASEACHEAAERLGRGAGVVFVFQIAHLGVQRVVFERLANGRGQYPTSYGGRKLAKLQQQSEAWQDVRDEIAESFVVELVQQEGGERNERSTRID